MMKNLIFIKALFCLLLLSVLLANCKKDEPTINLEGEWVGEFSYDDSASDVEIVSLTLASDGTISSVKSNNNGLSVNDSSWTLDGKIFAAVYSYLSTGNSINYTGQFDSKTGKLNCTWVTFQHSGKWIAEKVK